MTHIAFGNGKIKCNTGIVGGRKCLTMIDSGIPHEVVFADWDYLAPYRQMLEDKMDVFSRSIADGVFRGDAQGFRHARDLERH